MMTATDHPLVRDYLARLREESRRLPVDQARELEADITEHLQAALGEDPAEVAVRDALDRLGSPGELVTEAAGTPARSRAARRAALRSPRPVGAIACLLAAELLSLLVPIAFVLWVVGLVLLARATVWTEREKLLGFLGLGIGLLREPGSRSAWAWWPCARSGACLHRGQHDRRDRARPATAPRRAAASTTLGVVVLTLLAGYLAFQAFTIWRLARAAGRAATPR